MKKSYPTVLANICLLLAGVIFLFFFNTGAEVLKIVTIILGVLFIIPSLVYLCMVCFQKGEGYGATDLMGIFPAVGGFCFGTVLCLRPGIFGSIIVDIISIMLIALGLFHIVYLIMSHRRLKIRLWYYLAPLIITLAGIITLFVVKGNLEFLFLATGTSLILASFTAMIEGLAERRYNKQLEKESKAATSKTAINENEPSNEPTDTTANSTPPNTDEEKRLYDET